jgi:RNA dependent RNA polymerase
MSGGQPLPIQLLRCPERDHLWRALPAGTFWECARVALQKQLDLRNWSDRRVPELVGLPNEQGVGELCAWEGVEVLSEDAKWKEELDKEARAIFENKGRMLGIGVDGDAGDAFGTWYGGRVGFCATLDHESTSGDGPLALDTNSTITLEKPMMRGSCLFTRIWGSHRFLRLKLSKRLLKSVSNDRSGRFRNELKEYCRRPIHILGREYHPLVEKDGTVFYFLHGGQYVGLGIQAEGQETGPHIGTVDELVAWWLAPIHNQIQKVSKLISRLHLGISDTLPGVFIDPRYVQIEPDIGASVDINYLSS